MEHTPTVLAELEDYLRRENLTLAQFAEHSGIHPRTLSNLRNRYRPIAVQQLDQITLGMRLPEGFFYDLYIENYIIDRSTDWRRIEPLLQRCAEMDKLDAIQRVVQHIMEKLMYAPMLFETAEELFVQGRHAAALLLYESVAEGERFQHSERLALCQYRLFTLRLGDDQEQNLQTALQFEPFVERLDEIDQLDGLKELANAYRSLCRWDKLEQTVIKLETIAKIQYFMDRSDKRAHQEPQKKSSRPLFFYIAYSNLLRACIYAELKNYEQALQFTYAYADLSWVKETDTETLHWMNLFHEWAQANILAYKLLSGDVDILPEYMAYIETKPDEILPALFNVIESANRYHCDVDDILERFDSEITSYLNQPETIGTYTEQIMYNAFTLFFNDIAYYYLNKGAYNYGFNYLLKCIEKSAVINNKSCIIKSVGLYKSFRKHASGEVNTIYQKLIEEYEKENRTIVSRY